MLTRRRPACRHREKVGGHKLGKYVDNYPVSCSRQFPPLLHPLGVSTAPIH